MCWRPCWTQVSAIEKPLYWYEAKTSAWEVVLDILILLGKGL